MASSTYGEESTHLGHAGFAPHSPLLREWQSDGDAVAIPHRHSVSNRERSQSQRDRLHKIGKLTAEFCHQVRTPLCSLMLYAGQLDKSTPENRRLAQQVSRGLQDVRQLTNDMLGFAAGGRAEYRQLSVAELFADVVMNDQVIHGKDSRLTSCVADTSLSIVANKTALQGALLNLINNAREAGDVTTRILLHARRYGELVHFCVTDDGPGIADELKARVFEPFFTTQPQGTGLGLSIVDAVAKDHGGDVDFISSKLGSSFTIRLPSVDFGETLA